MMFNAFCLDSKSAAAASCFLLLLMLSSIQLVGGFVAYARRNVGGCKIEKTTAASWIEHIGCRPLDRQVAHKPKLPSKYRATQSSSIRVEERNYPFDSRPLVPKGVWSETILKANAMSACDFSPRDRYRPIALSIFLFFVSESELTGIKYSVPNDWREKCPSFPTQAKA